MKLLFETFKEIGKEFYIKKKDRWINYNPLKKTVVYVVDHDSHRSASMARELRKKRWKIILMKSPIILLWIIVFDYYQS